MAAKATVYYRNNGKRAVIKYDKVTAIKAGTAAQLFSADDIHGNGLRPDAALIQLEFSDGTCATFDADNVTILF